MLLSQCKSNTDSLFNVLFNDVKNILYLKHACLILMDSLFDFQNTCTLNCLEKYLKMTQRISQRFQEYQMTQSDSAASVQNLASQK